MASLGGGGHPPLWDSTNKHAGGGGGTPLAGKTYVLSHFGLQRFTRRGWSTWVRLYLYTAYLFCSHLLNLKKGTGGPLFGSFFSLSPK